jgi:protein-disulfide isomerase
LNSVENTSEAKGETGRVGYWVSIVASVLGVGLSYELTKLHFLLEKDPSHESYCNVSQTINCDAVAKSTYSVFWGLPLSVWGLFAYTIAIFISVWGIRTKRAAPAALILLLGGVATLGALVLAYLSAFVIGSWCLLCAASWGVDLTLLVCGLLMVAPAFKASFLEVVETFRKQRLTVVLLGGLTLVALLVTGQTLSQKTPDSALPQLSVKASSTKPAMVTGLTEAGHPYIGAAKPKVLIEEFSDYQCPFCAKAHATLRALVNRYPDSIRVVHRHFPLDNDCNKAITRPFHTHACYYAKLAVCAATLNRFWETNDFLFHHGHDEAPVAVGTLAREVGVDGELLQQCLSSKSRDLLAPDIEEGIRLKIDGTPTFVINGEKVTGQLPETLLEQYPL